MNSPTDFDNYLVSKANDVSITTYSNGDVGEMYTFSHDETDQTTSLVDYRYIGNNPDNYIYYNCGDPNDTSTCEIWRILGIFPVDDGNGNIENRIKLVSGTGIVDGNGFSQFSWDYKTNSTGLYGITSTGGVNQWGESVLTTDSSVSYPGADLMMLFNSGAYYNRTTGTCVAYDTNLSTSVASTTTCNFSDSSSANKGLSASAKSVIGAAKYYLGSISTLGSLNGTYNSYIAERTLNTWTATYDDIVRTSDWVGRVGLMYMSDYVYSYGYGVDSTCFSTIHSCTNYSNSWIYNSNDRGNDDTIFHQWLINNRKEQIFSVMIYDVGKVDLTLRPYNVYAVRPTVYLNVDVLAQSGDGSSENPYHLYYN